MKKLEKIVAQAAAKGVRLLVFGETWLSGYPAWLDCCSEAAIWNNPVVKRIYANMLLNSITVSGPETKRIGALARKHGMIIVLGINERTASGPGNGTIYNSLLIIGSDGRLWLHHRKLMPTFGERLVYGLGDGRGLHAVDTEWGRLSALICWEHWMPLTRQALHDSGEMIHIALWPSVHDVHQLASRHYAFEGRCYVVAVGQILKAAELPAELKLPAAMSKGSQPLIMNGGSAIIGPDGQYCLEPQWDKDELILFTIKDLQRVLEERMTLDTSGHYSCPDIFNFSIKSFETKNN
jgi:predicted amidohydrolase